MKKMTQHDKVIRLCEGGLVEIDGHCVILVSNIPDDDPCYLCHMDCICHGEMAVICAECEHIIGAPCILELVNG